MEHRQHNDPLLLFNKKDFVWKSTSQSPAGFTINFQVLLWVSGNGMKKGINAKQKVGPKAGNTGFVPIERFGHFDFCLGSND